MSAHAENSPAARPSASPLRRFGRREARAADPGSESLEAVLAEVVLLREENARLKADRHRPASLGRVLAQIGAMPEEPDEADVADDTAQMLVEAMVLRESLLEVCRELEQAIGGVTARLERLGDGPIAATGALEGGRGGGDA
jgi:hypothetical protein